MKKKGDRPITKTKHPEPSLGTTDWIIWAAWADRITFEDIFEQTGFTEAQVIRLMRQELKRRSFQLWRKRVYHQSIKHRKKFAQKKRQEKWDGTY